MALTCGFNEEPTNSGYDCITCQNRMSVTCAKSNQTRCRCKDGYIRFDNGYCLSMEECHIDGNFTCKITKYFMRITHNSP